MGALTRADVVQHMLDISDGKTYLEIGVDCGQTFFSVQAPRKIAVDPSTPIQAGLRRTASNVSIYPIAIHPLVEESRKLIQASRRYLQPQAGEAYVHKTSDEFFRHDAPRLLQDGIDVAFIDGLHTHQQSLKDLENCLEYLNPGGAIVLHDCSPTSWAMAYPAQGYDDASEEVRRIRPSQWTGEWCGDVWKTPVYLRSQRPDLEVVVLDTDYGVGIVRPGIPMSMLDYTPEEIRMMPYERLDADRHVMLNLRRPEHLYKIGRLQYGTLRQAKTA